MHIETRDGTYLHVKDMGEGHPVILIHGWPLTGDMWEYQTLALLEAGYRVITYDRRGFGHSTHTAHGYDYDTFADDLADIIEHLELDGFCLVGFSMGGGEIVRYLSRYGTGKVMGAALISSVVPYLLKDPSNEDGVDETIFEKMEQDIREDRFAFLQSFAKQFYGVGLVSRPVSQALMDWTFALAMMAGPLATIRCIEAFSRTDFRHDMENITIPTLVIHGTDDKTVPIDVSGRKAAASISGARLIEYEGEPHGLFATAPHRLNSDLLAFLDDRRADSHTPSVRQAETA